MRNPFGRPGRSDGKAPGTGASQGDGWFRPDGGPAADRTAGKPPGRKTSAGKPSADGRSPRKRRLVRALWAGLGMVGLLLAIVLVAYTRISIPPANASALRQTSQVYYADNKTVLGRFGDTNRIIVPLTQMPEPLRNAVLAAENRTFYSDSGISPRGIGRAIWVNLRGGSTQGGSTITQQYVKNYYLTSERTIKRKFREALLSIKIDKDLSKDQILENYLNTIYLGRGAYGMQAAANAYFNVDVSKLTVAQGACLAAIIRSPAHYDPSTASGLAALQPRWNYVLDGMVATKTLSPADRAALTFPKFPKQAQNASRYGGQRGYLLQAIEKELIDRNLTKDQVENGGLSITTTLDAQAQASAEAAVPAQFPKTQNKGVRVGLAAIEPGTGRILAMYGGKDFLGKDKYAQVNNATTPIQPGSGMKPFALAAALENGFSLDSTFTGKSPFVFPGGKIRNEFNTSYGKKVSLYDGLEQSINTVFVDMTLQVGPQKVREAMVRAGIPNDAPGLNNFPLVGLGVASIRPTEVADAYATLCAGGIHAEAHIVDSVKGPNGGVLVLKKIEKSADPVFAKPIISDVLRAMEYVVNGPNGTGARARALGRPVAGKTGTHQSLTAWFNGCTPQIAASVNYFRGDGTDSLDGVGGLPTFFGAVYPTQTWTAFMSGALKGKPVKDFGIGAGVKGTATPTATPTDTGAPQPTGEPTSGGITFPPFPPFTLPPGNGGGSTPTPTQPAATTEPSGPPATEPPATTEPSPTVNCTRHPNFPGCPNPADTADPGGPGTGTNPG
ncbi:MAG TPA: transglycosylase domain-containing protein [Sporichthyaceae bacterium]